MDFIGIIGNALEEMIREMKIDANEAEEARKFVIKEPDKTSVKTGIMLWNYKTAARVLKPVFEILENEPSDTDAYKMAFKFFEFATHTRDLGIDGSYHRIMKSFMKENLTFFQATLLDLTATNFAGRTYAITYQEGTAKECYDKDKDFFYFILENLFKVDKSFILSSDRTKFYYNAFRYGYLAQMCNEPQLGIQCDRILSQLVDFEKTMGSSVISEITTSFSSTITNFCYKYFYEMYARANKDSSAFLAEVEAVKDSVVSYRYQLEAFSRDEIKSDALKIAAHHLFNSERFKTEVFSQKTIESLPYYLIKQIMKNIQPEQKSFVVLSTLMYSPIASVLQDCSKQIIENEQMKKDFVALYEGGITCKKTNKDEIEKLHSKLKEIESKTQKFELQKFDNDCIKRLIEHKNSSKSHHFYGVAQAIIVVLENLNKIYKNQEQYFEALNNRINCVFTFSEFLSTCQISSNIEIVTRAIRSIIDNDEALANYFSALLLNDYSTDDMISALEKASGANARKLVLQCVFFNTSKKVIGFCEKAINADYDNYKDEFMRLQEVNLSLKKDNALAVKNIVQRNENSNINFDSIDSIESFSSAEQLSYGKVFKAIDFSKLSQVLYKNGSAVSIKTLEVIYDKYFSMSELYRLPLCDNIVKHFNKNSFRNFTEEVFNQWESGGYDSKTKALAVPYCFYTSNDNLAKLKKECISLCEIGKHAVTVYLIEAMAMNGGKYALMLVDNMANKFPFPKSRQTAKDAMGKAAAKYKISVDQLGDFIIPNYGFDVSGNREFLYNNENMCLQLMPSGEVKLLKGDKEIKTIPNPASGADKLLKDEYSSLKKEMKTLIKMQTVRLESNLMTGFARSFKDFNNVFMKNPAVRGLVSSLVWGIYSQEGDLKQSFCFNLDGSLTDCEYNEVIPKNDDIIALVHPCDCTDNGVAAWRTYLADNQIKQPFMQMNQNTLFFNEITEKGLIASFEKFNFCYAHVLKLSNRYNMIRLPVTDGAGFYGHYMENTENDIGVDILMDELYISCDSSEGSNLKIAFYRPSQCPMSYSNHEKCMPVAQVPTRFSSTLLNSLQQIYGSDLALNCKGAVIKAAFKLPRDAGDFSLDDEEIEDTIKVVSNKIAAKGDEVKNEASKESKSEKVKSVLIAAKVSEKTVPTIAPTAAKVVSVAAPASGGNIIYLEFVEGTSSKFWQVQVSGASHIVTYGRIGTVGVSATKSFESEAKAKADADKLVKSKTSKGYVCIQK